MCLGLDVRFRRVRQVQACDSLGSLPRLLPSTMDAGATAGELAEGCRPLGGTIASSWIADAVGV